MEMLLPQAEDNETENKPNSNYKTDDTYFISLSEERKRAYQRSNERQNVSENKEIITNNKKYLSKQRNSISRDRYEENLKK